MKSIFLWVDEPATHVSLPPDAMFLLKTHTLANTQSSSFHLLGDTQSMKYKSACRSEHSKEELSPVGQALLVQNNLGMLWIGRVLLIRNPQLGVNPTRHGAAL